MSILGNPITLGGGGADLNIDFGSTPPTETSKLWVPLGKKPDKVEITDIKSGLYSLEKSSFEQPWGSGNLAIVGNKLYVIGGTRDQAGQGYASRDITVYDLESGAKEIISNVLHSKTATDNAGPVVVFMFMEITFISLVVIVRGLPHIQITILRLFNNLTQ